MKKNPFFEQVKEDDTDAGFSFINQSIESSWSKIAPFWPLKNLIAVNPIAGFEHLAFEEALRQADAYFRQKNLPVGMQQVNKESIKWLQAFFDEGQATIQMPMRNRGLLSSVLSLIRFDHRLHQGDNQKIRWLGGLPKSAEKVVAEVCLYLGIAADEQTEFLTLLLTTLPGWAAHIQYRTGWPDSKDAQHPHPVTKSEYLAFRSILMCLIWPEAKSLLAWHRQAIEKADMSKTYQGVLEAESDYQAALFEKLSLPMQPENIPIPAAQLVFCIDVRSEPLRRAVEAQGSYATYGVAGFFGVPVSIENDATGDTYASCPVLLKPKHRITERPTGSQSVYQRGQLRLRGMKRLYQSLKYTFSAPFVLVEAMGFASGLWMVLKSLIPGRSAAIELAIKRFLGSEAHLLQPDMKAIPFEQQVVYGESVLKLLGLTTHFAPLVVFCGHGSTTQNNVYATSLDCGACGGRHGGANARIIAEILNNGKVRQALHKKGVSIPQSTLFLAAAHNTTTDNVAIYDHDFSPAFDEKICALRQDLAKASAENSRWRMEVGALTASKNAAKAAALRACDWAQVRPEWGLASNAAFVIGPRWLTQGLNLEGRVFLHSYEWEQDADAELLTTILTAPMIVAQWINAQYFFSTLDNVAFGGGSKVTKNITGKIGVMQGNASDLMHGLPLQSVYENDKKVYHQSIRLTVVVYAPKSRIMDIIKQHDLLQKLFGNEWIFLVCYEPDSKKKYRLTRALNWVEIE